MMKRSYCILTLVAVLALTGSLQTARAQVPARISYQGLVLDQNQATLADGTYSVTFRLYAEEDGIGQALWSETQAVPIQGGLLSTMIGAEQALNLPFDRPYYLTVQLEGQAESERMALSAAAYALLARDVPDSTVVRSISGLQDAVEIVAGDGITIQQHGNQLIISAAGRAGLKGYGPDDTAGSIDASIKIPMTEEEDEEAVKALLATLGTGGSNTGLDLAYDTGRIITLDDGKTIFQGLPNNIGLEVRDADMMIREAFGDSPEYRLRVEGVSTVQVFRMRLDAVTGEYRLVNTTAGSTVPFRVTKDATDDLLTLDASALEISDASGTTTITLNADFGGDGRVITEELEITGGSDLSENFDVSGGFGIAAPEPGMVVSIDPSSPGRLTVSGTPYDRMVAGVVSGAGGIETGLIMGQRGSVADGATPVALTGRVYVFVDASYGAVSPGDLLTSSSTAGHAMKVSDYGQAQGAILGKAMTGLSEGQGLVLMLISLQ